MSRKKDGILFRTSSRGYNRDDVNEYILGESRKFSEIESSFMRTSGELRAALDGKTAECDSLSASLNEAADKAGAALAAKEEAEKALEAAKTELEAVKSELEAAKSELETAQAELDELRSEKVYVPAHGASNGTNTADEAGKIMAEMSSGMQSALENCMNDILTIMKQNTAPASSVKMEKVGTEVNRRMGRLQGDFNRVINRILSDYRGKHAKK